MTHRRLLLDRCIASPATPSPITAGKRQRGQSEQPQKSGGILNGEPENGGGKTLCMVRNATAYRSICEPNERRTHSSPFQKPGC